MPILGSIIARALAWRGTPWLLLAFIICAIIGGGIVLMRSHAREVAIAEARARQAEENRTALGEMIASDIEDAKVARAEAEAARVRALQTARTHAEINRRRRAAIEVSDVTEEDLARWDRAIERQAQELRQRGIQ